MSRLRLVKAMALAAALAGGASGLQAQAPSSTAIGKVVASTIEGTTTYMVLESISPLETSQSVYLQGGITLTIRELISVQDTDNIYYYKAYTPEKVRVLPGEAVYLEPTKRPSRLPSFEKAALFMKKKYATVTMSEGGQVLINRGSLHNVDKRDIYKVYAAQGKYKGEIELEGIGDFLSSGISYYPFERGGKKFSIEKDDEAVFFGNRKAIGAGLLVVLNPNHFRSGNPSDSKVDYAGGGVLFSRIYRRGHIFELLAGGMTRDDGSISGIQSQRSTYFFPFWYRKAFFYPGHISPFISLGLARYELRLAPSYKSFPGVMAKEKAGFAPLMGGGLELSSGETVHLRLDVQHCLSPKQEFPEAATAYDTAATFYMAAVTFNW